MTRVAFTICSRNYLAYALTLRRSFLAHAPDTSFYIFLADAPIDGADPCELIVPVAQIGLPDLADMALRYGVMEFNTAVKPFCFEWLFDAAGADAAIYLDPDIYVVAPLDHVTSALNNGADAVLTPHFRTPPPDDGERPTAEDIAASGRFNLGFAAFANQPAARTFIWWWAEQCAVRCFNDLANGLFVDQKFVERAPEMIKRTEIIEHPGYNAAYWNLHERPIGRMADGAWAAGGQRLRFFHFSGVAPGDPSVFSRHQTRYSPAATGALAPLFMTYLSELEAAGHERWSHVPYAFDDDGANGAITPAARRVYARRRGGDGCADEADPAPPALRELNAPSPEIEQRQGRISVFMHEAWRMRPDLQAAFPLATVAGRRGFRRWFLLHGAEEAKANRDLMAPVRGGGVGLAIDAARAVLNRLPEKWRRALLNKINPSNS